MLVVGVEINVSLCTVLLMIKHCIDSCYVFLVGPAEFYAVLLPTIYNILPILRAVFSIELGTGPDIKYILKMCAIQTTSVFYNKQNTMNQHAD